jgi:hypothetical protein
MKRAVGGAALAVALAVASAASAAGANLNAGVKAGASTDVNASVDTGATGSIVGSADVSTTVSAMNATKAQVDTLKKLHQIKSIKIMRLDASASADAQFKAAIEKNKGDTASLRTAIQGNADLQAKLKSQNVMVESIVALDVDANGNVIVYTQG